MRGDVRFESSEGIALQGISLGQKALAIIIAFGITVALSVLPLIF